MKLDEALKQSEVMRRLDGEEGGSASRPYYEDSYYPLRPSQDKIIAATSDGYCYVIWKWSDVFEVLYEIRCPTKDKDDWEPL